MALAFLVSALIPYNRDVYEEAVGAEILAACMKSVLCGAVSWVLCLGKALAQWFPSSLLSLSSHLRLVLISPFFCSPTVSCYVRLLVGDEGQNSQRSLRQTALVYYGSLLL